MNDIPNSSRDTGQNVLTSLSEEKISKKYIEILKVIGRTSLGSIYMVDLCRKKIKLISEKPLLFSDLRSNEIERLGYNFYRKYTKPEDLEILESVSNLGFKFFKCLPFEDRQSYSITYDFHLTNVNNVNVLINHKITPLEFCEDGNMIKALCVFSYSLNKKAGNLCVGSNNSEIFWRYNFKTGKWLEESKITLKMREVQIIQLYLQGFKIEEIAERLFVSPNTIKFHRSKLFEKIGVNNITEAISYVISNNLI